MSKIPCKHGTIYKNEDDEKLFWHGGFVQIPQIFAVYKDGEIVKPSDLIPKDRKVVYYESGGLHLTENYSQVCGTDTILPFTYQLSDSVFIDNYGNLQCEHIYILRNVEKITNVVPTERKFLQLGINAIRLDIREDLRLTRNLSHTCPKCRGRSTNSMSISGAHFTCWGREIDRKQSKKSRQACHEWSCTKSHTQTGCYRYEIEFVLSEGFDEHTIITNGETVSLLNFLKDPIDSAMKPLEYFMKEQEESSVDSSDSLDSSDESSDSSEESCKKPHSKAVHKKAKKTEEVTTLSENVIRVELNEDSGRIQLPLPSEFNLNLISISLIPWDPNPGSRGVGDGLEARIQLSYENSEVFARFYTEFNIHSWDHIVESSIKPLHGYFIPKGVKIYIEEITYNGIEKCFAYLHYKKSV